MSTELPVHDSLYVVGSEDIYRNDEWWKSVVRYQFDPDDDHSEVAVYLWHNDDGWTRKNKYVIKTTDAWITDKAIIDQLFSTTAESQSDGEFPTSDYYSLAAGETVFRSDGWWKAIVKIAQKGSYETEEVMVYLWQEVDGDWRRRQKYTNKSEESWQDEAEVIESVLDHDAQQSEPQPTTTAPATVSGDSESQMGDIEQLSRELDAHLSENRT